MMIVNVEQRCKKKPKLSLYIKIISKRMGGVQIVFKNNDWGKSQQNGFQF